MRSVELVAAARLDLGEALRSRWLSVYLILYALLGAAFLWVGLRESSVLGFTGSGRVLFSLAHALVLILPLLALLATGQAVNRSREDGSLELFLAQPIERSAYLAGVTLVRWCSLVIPLALVMGSLAVAASLWHGQAVPWAVCGRALAVCTGLLTAYVGVGLALSVLVRNSARAMASALGVWLASIALLDFAGLALLLRWRLPPEGVFALAALNPVQAARLALLSLAEPTLGALGPVGFYLANQLGTGLLLAIGLAWPPLLGVACWLLALARFRRGDAV
jgi:ABC-type transport system involved in multi-copper enzyme maturation permease subunit